MPLCRAVNSGIIVSLCFTPTIGTSLATPCSTSPPLLWRAPPLALKSAAFCHVRSLLLVLPLGQPQLLESSQRAQDGPPDPHAEPTLDRRSGQCSNLFFFWQRKNGGRKSIRTKNKTKQNKTGRRKRQNRVEWDEKGPVNVRSCMHLSWRTATH